MTKEKTLPLVVDVDSRAKGRFSVEITDDMEPQEIDVVEGDSISFREFFFEFPRAGTYRIGVHGVRRVE